MTQFYVLLYGGKGVYQKPLFLADSDYIFFNPQIGDFVECPEEILSSEKLRRKFGLKPTESYVFRITHVENSLIESTVFLSPVRVSSLPTLVEVCS